MSQERIVTENSSKEEEQSAKKTLKATLAKELKDTTKVRVVHGAHQKYHEFFVGKKVGDVKNSLRELFNISKDAKAILDGVEVSDEHILQGGTCLEFHKETGKKGCF